MIGGGKRPSFLLCGIDYGRKKFNDTTNLSRIFLLSLSNENEAVFTFVE